MEAINTNLLQQTIVIETGADFTPSGKRRARIESGMGKGRAMIASHYQQSHQNGTI